MKKRFLSKLLTGTLVAATLAVGLTGCGSSTGSSTTGTGTVENESKEDAQQSDDTYSDTITIVWYPNESAEDYDVAREEYGRLIEQATGKTVEHKLTTDYTIAIESIASGSAQISFMGAEGYVQAKNSNDAVLPLFVDSGASGTLDDALYYSFLAVNEADAAEYETSDGYSIDNIAGKKMSFVSNSSTSGFKVPTNGIVSHFTATSD